MLSVDPAKWEWKVGHLSPHPSLSSHNMESRGHRTNDITPRPGSFTPRWRYSLTEAPVNWSGGLGTWGDCGVGGDVKDDPVGLFLLTFQLVSLVGRYFS